MFNSVSSEERKTLIIWAILGFIIFLIAIMFKLLLDKDNVEEYDKYYKVVRDHSRYYTVATAINKYYSYLDSNSYSNVLNILDEKYIKENNITVDNIKEYVSTHDKSFSFDSRKMCSKRLSKSITSFYVKGLEKEMNTAKIIKENYYEVVLDEKELVFSIKPITEKVYGGNCNG